MATQHGSNMNDDKVASLFRASALLQKNIPKIFPITIIFLNTIFPQWNFSPLEFLIIEKINSKLFSFFH